MGDRSDTIDGVVRGLFYWFKRGRDLIRYEAREIAPAHFELQITEPSGIERIERFDDEVALHRRQLEFEQQLAKDGWAGPHGWNV
jgi:hypothetical protein